ncbi:MAG: hypothetical protein ABIR11_10065, partial [Candidatus Limnocylindrales bacterium]
MPTATRLARHLAAACLAVATLLGTLPGPVAALEPPTPLPGYRPTFVTETDTRPWTDCLWSSGAMLLDKWTNGDVRVTREALRAASGDPFGGSSLDDMQVAFKHYGFDLQFSPDGGTRVTWGQLLYRLAHGAGAVLLGDDSKLPRWYGRWDYGFWKGKGKDDNHAVYIEAYDRKRGRVWLMDPLGRGDWKGEWNSTFSLRKFAWSRGGAMYVAMTPTAKAAPFAGVRASKLKLVLSPTAVDAAWSIKAPSRWRFPGADVRAAFVPAADPLVAAAVSPALPVRTVGSPSSAAGRATIAGKSLHVSVALPTKPGAYVASLTLRDRRFGRAVVRAEDVAVFISGDRRATLRLNIRNDGAEAGSAIPVSISVANSGTLTWADTNDAVTAATHSTTLRATRVEARWIPLDVPGSDQPGSATTKAAGGSPTPDTDPEAPSTPSGSLPEP